MVITAIGSSEGFSMGIPASTMEKGMPPLDGRSTRKTAWNTKVLKEGKAGEVKICKGFPTSGRSSTFHRPAHGPPSAASSRSVLQKGRK